MKTIVYIANSVLAMAFPGDWMTWATIYIPVTLHLFFS